MFIRTFGLNQTVLKRVVGSLADSDGYLEYYCKL
jgi:hypothetical protein